MRGPARRSLSSRSLHDRGALTEGTLQLDGCHTPFVQTDRATRLVPKERAHVASRHVNPGRKTRLKDHSRATGFCEPSVTMSNSNDPRAPPNVDPVKGVSEVAQSGIRRSPSRDSAFFGPRVPGGRIAHPPPKVGDGVFAWAPTADFQRFEENKPPFPPEFFRLSARAVLNGANSWA